MAIEVLPEGVPAGFEVLGVEDPNRQLDQPLVAEQSHLCTREFWNLQWVGNAIGLGACCGPVAFDVADLELPVLYALLSAPLDRPNRPTKVTAGAAPAS